MTEGNTVQNELNSNLADIVYRVTRTSKQFLITNDIWGQFVEGPRGRIELNVLVGDDTTAEQWREAWGEITRIRAWLLEQQGTDMEALHNAFLDRYARLKEAGSSYAEVAELVNHDVLVSLCSMVAAEDYFGDHEVAARYFVIATRVLRAMQMKLVSKHGDGVYNWIVSATGSIKDGCMPWLPGGEPVSAERLRDALRSWDKSPEKANMKVPPPMELVTEEEAVETNPIYSKAFEILEGLKPAT